MLGAPEKVAYNFKTLALQFSLLENSENWDYEVCRMQKVAPLQILGNDIEGTGWLQLAHDNFKNLFFMAQPFSLQDL